MKSQDIVNDSLLPSPPEITLVGLRIIICGTLQKVSVVVHKPFDKNSQNKKCKPGMAENEGFRGYY
jgi:hypothetical protein